MTSAPSRSIRCRKSFFGPAFRHQRDEVGYSRSVQLVVGDVVALPEKNAENLKAGVAENLTYRGEVFGGSDSVTA
jgi:hypothetical protein